MSTEAETAGMWRDHDSCYRAVASKDPRFDGMFHTAVHTTGIYCRPSCPARTPASRNVSFFPSAAAAQAKGFRACKRCLPDATPGSPEWNLAADVAGRAMRLIADGVVDREGVEGLATTLGYTPRHLGRILDAHLGAGPLALARAHRARTARSLIESSTLSLSDIAFASGFASIRQFNATMREVYDTAPRDFRRATVTPTARGAQIAVRLGVRAPWAGAALLTFLATRAIPGVEYVDGSTYSRTLDLPHGPGWVSVDLIDIDAPGTPIEARFGVHDLKDLPAAVERTRRLLDADADPLAVSTVLTRDPGLASSVAANPGLRVPGHVSGAEVAVRAIVGQQVSVAGARTVLGQLAAQHGVEVPTDVAGLTHLFPSPQTLSRLDPHDLPMPRARGRALIGLMAAVASGDITIELGADRSTTRAALLALPGIGPWTADYIAMRAWGDPDVLMTTDLGVKHGATALNLALTEDRTDTWRPWRSYAQMHLWEAASPHSKEI